MKRLLFLSLILILLFISFSSMASATTYLKDTWSVNLTANETDLNQTLKDTWSASLVSQSVFYDWYLKDMWDNSLTSFPSYYNWHLKDTWDLTAQSNASLGRWYEKDTWTNYAYSNYTGATKNWLYVTSIDEYKVYKYYDNYTFICNSSAQSGVIRNIIGDDHYLYTLGDDKVTKYYKDNLTINRQITQYTQTDVFSFKETFDTYAYLSDLNGQNNWSGDVDFRINNNTYFDGGWSCENELDGGGEGISQPLDNAVDGTLTFYMRSTEATGKMNVSLRNATADIFSVGFGTDGHIKYLAENNTMINLPTDTLYTKNNWFKVEIQFDCVMDKYDYIIIDNVTKGSNLDAMETDTLCNLTLRKLIPAWSSYWDSINISGNSVNSSINLNYPTYICNDTYNIYFAEIEGNIFKMDKYFNLINITDIYSGNFIYCMALDDNYLYVGNENYITIFYKENLTVFNETALPVYYNIRDLAEDGEYLYVLADEIDTYLIKYLIMDDPNDALYLYNWNEIESQTSKMLFDTHTCDIFLYGDLGVISKYDGYTLELINKSGDYGTTITGLTMGKYDMGINNVTYLYAVGDSVDRIKSYDTENLTLNKTSELLNNSPYKIIYSSETLNTGWHIQTKWTGYIQSYGFIAFDNWTVYTLCHGWFKMDEWHNEIHNKFLNQNSVMNIITNIMIPFILLFLPALLLREDYGNGGFVIGLVIGAVLCILADAIPLSLLIVGLICIGILFFKFREVKGNA